MAVSEEAIRHAWAGAGRLAASRARREHTLARIEENLEQILV